MNTKLRDAGSERSLLGTIVKGGKDALIDADGIIDTTDFGLNINRIVYASLKALAEDPNCVSFDVESIKLKAKALGFQDQISSKKDLEYLELLDSVNFDKSNIPMFALQIKKYSVARDLYNRYSDALDYLNNISGNESLSDIIKEAEGKVIDAISGTDGTASLENLTNSLTDYVYSLIEAEEVDQVGIPTGFPLYDEAIGGGLRRGTVSVKGARPKVGKSWDALNTALNVARRKIPVLYLDSELNFTYQRNRLVCINSECPISLFETGKFKHDKNLARQVIEASKEIESLPLYYESISGMDHSEALALVRRWLVKHVGFNEEGKANDCLIIYDYLKLTGDADISKAKPEYLILGLAITNFHVFAVKYDVPFLTYVQLNREGIDGEDTSVISGSDRILWLCSSMSILKNKTEDDINVGCGWEYGNKKLIVLETRHGSGLETYGDYVNLHCSLRPNINKDKASGLMREGFLFSQVSRR